MTVLYYSRIYFQHARRRRNQIFHPIFRIEIDASSDNGNTVRFADLADDGDERFVGECAFDVEAFGVLIIGGDDIHEFDLVMIEEHFFVGGGVENIEFFVVGFIANFV